MENHTVSNGLSNDYLIKHIEAFGRLVGRNDER